MFTFRLLKERCSYLDTLLLAAQHLGVAVLSLCIAVVTARETSSLNYPEVKRSSQRHGNGPWWSLQFASPCVFGLCLLLRTVGLTLLIMRCMMVLGTRSLVDLLMMPMYESTRLRMVSTCRSSWGSMENVSGGAASSFSVCQLATRKTQGKHISGIVVCRFKKWWPESAEKRGAAGTYLVLLRIDACPEEGRFPAVHILLRITGQFYLTEILVHVPVQMNKWHTHTQTVTNALNL